MMDSVKSQHIKPQALSCSTLFNSVKVDVIWLFKAWSYLCDVSHRCPFKYLAFMSPHFHTQVSGSQDQDWERWHLLSLSHLRVSTIKS
jgi:hypothetical protein